MKSALILTLLAAALSAACANPVAPSAMPSVSASAPVNVTDGGSGGSGTFSTQKMMGQPKIGEGKSSSQKVMGQPKIGEGRSSSQKMHGQPKIGE